MRLKVGSDLKGVALEGINYIINIDRMRRHFCYGKRIEVLRFYLIESDVGIVGILEF